MSHLYYVIIITALLGCAKEEVSTSITEPGDSFKINEIHVRMDTLDGDAYVVVGNGRKSMMAAFYSTWQNESLTFSETDKPWPLVMQDDQGNFYNMLGEVVRGPNRTRRLKPVNSGIGFWFAFSSRYPGMELVSYPDYQVQIDLEGTDEWLVPIEYVQQGAGFDAIVALDDPQMKPYHLIKTDPEIADPIKEDDLVIVIEHKGIDRVYPINILNWHEIVNDEIEGRQVLITHCPLTGTSRVWEVDTPGEFGGFGVSGFVYNSNLLMFDRETQSLWTQLEGKCVYGPYQHYQLTNVPFYETTWGNYRRLNRDFLLMSIDTGMNRDYSIYPYGEYRSDHGNISYPIAILDPRQRAKEWVFAVEINGQAKGYVVKEF